MKALTKTNFAFPGQTDVYHGKVRDVYFIGKDLLCMVKGKGTNHENYENGFDDAAPLVWHRLTWAPAIPAAT